MIKSKQIKKMMDVIEVNVISFLTKEDLEVLNKLDLEPETKRSPDAVDAGSKSEGGW